MVEIFSQIEINFPSIEMVKFSTEGPIEMVPLSENSIHLESPFKLYQSKQYFVKSNILDKRRDSRIREMEGSIHDWCC